MDSHIFLRGNKGGGYSKAQMCLQKILGIICSVPPPYQQITKAEPSFHRHNLLQLDSSSSSSSQDKAHPFGGRGLLIDLNSELTSSHKTETKSLAVDDQDDDSSSQGTKGNPASETDIEDDVKRGTEPFCSRKEEGALALLIERGDQALGYANGELERDGLSSGLGIQEINVKESVKKGREKRGVYLYGRMDGEVSQVVRTKRGRQRVLPCRYRDSVLQPLARNSGARKRHRLR